MDPEEKELGWSVCDTPGGLLFQKVVPVFLEHVESEKLATTSDRVVMPCDKNSL